MEGDSLWIAKLGMKRVPLRSILPLGGDLAPEGCLLLKWSPCPKGLFSHSPPPPKTVRLIKFGSAGLAPGEKGWDPQLEPVFRLRFLQDPLEETIFGVFLKSRRVLDVQFQTELGWGGAATG